MEYNILNYLKSIFSKSNHPPSAIYKNYYNGFATYGIYTEHMHLNPIQKWMFKYITGYTWVNKEKEEY